MSDYWIGTSGSITGNLSVHMDFDPKDFICCDTISEVKDSIIDNLYGEINLGDLNLHDWYYEDFDLPDSFIKEWEELKNG